MEKDQATEMLEEAKCAIAQALEDIREATDNDAHIEAYLCAPLSIICCEGRYCSPHDLNLEQVIEDLKDDDDKEGMENLQEMIDEVQALAEYATVAGHWNVDDAIRYDNLIEAIANKTE